MYACAYVCFQLNARKVNEKLSRELFVSAGYFAPSLTGVKALRVVLYSLLIRNISKLWIFPKMPVLSAKQDRLSHERTRGHTTKTQRKWEKLCHKQPRLENSNQNFPREDWTLKNREFFGWIAIILFYRGRGRSKRILGNNNWRE